jgi:hypothetical protein
MKHSFQIITISIIAVLTVVLCGQIYWLHGLYQSIRQETYATLTSAMEMADFNEISARIKSTNRKDKKHAWKSKHLAFNYDFDIYFQSPLKLMRLVDGGIHNILDPLVPIDFKEFCRLFQRECKVKGINIDVYEVMFYGKNGHGQYYTPPGMKMVDAGLVKYHNVEGDYTYEVFVTPLTDIYLHRMRGIILTTILIIVFLAFAGATDKPCGDCLGC